MWAGAGAVPEDGIKVNHYFGSRRCVLSVCSGAGWKNLVGGVR